ncbi:uncharacterized protein LOC135146241 [Zophobas morio]|uniref:uncharacterized protein LOC135146241 n=1 Tax=Zophobas morio TaxID=2755281 RepID=UPI0030834333
MSAGIDLSHFDLEGIDVSSLNLDKLEDKFREPFQSNSYDSDNIKYGFADMTGISRLNEKSVLHNLMIRFQNDRIFTYIGSVLVSVNPFKRLLGLYDEPKSFRGKTLQEKPPHIFALAEKAYASMMGAQQNQTFLIRQAITAEHAHRVCLVTCLQR